MSSSAARDRAKANWQIALCRQRKRDGFTLFMIELHAIIIRFMSA